MVTDFLAPCVARKSANYHVYHVYTSYEPIYAPVYFISTFEFHIHSFLCPGYCVVSDAFCLEFTGHIFVSESV